MEVDHSRGAQGVYPPPRHTRGMTTAPALSYSRQTSPLGASASLNYRPPRLKVTGPTGSAYVNIHLHPPNHRSRVLTRPLRLVILMHAPGS